MQAMDEQGKPGETFDGGDWPTHAQQACISLLANHYESIGVGRVKGTDHVRVTYREGYTDRVDILDVDGEDVTRNAMRPECVAGFDLPVELVRRLIGDAAVDASVEAALDRRTVSPQYQLGADLGSGIRDAIESLLAEAGR